MFGPPLSSPPRVARLPEHAAEPDLTGQPRVRGIGDVVLAHVAVEPVREVEEAVVHREDEVGDQARHRERPALERDALDLDHRVCRPAAVVGGSATSRSRAPHRRSPLGVGVVEPADLERDEALLAEVDRLLELAASRFQKWIRRP